MRRITHPRHDTRCTAESTPPPFGCTISSESRKSRVRFPRASRKGIRTTFFTPTIKIVIDTFFWETFLKLIFIIYHIRSLLEAPTRDTIRDARRNRHPGSPFLKLEFRVSNPNVQLRWCRSLVFRYRPTCSLYLFRSVLDRIGMGLLELSKKSQ